MHLSAISCVFHRLAARRIVYQNVLSFNRPVNRLKFRSSSSVSRAGFEDYDKERASWNVTIPEKFNFASDVVDAWARKEKEGLRDASVPAFWFVSERGQEIKWNYQALEYETKRVANMLQKKCGIQRGTHVIVMLPKVPDFWLINVAAIRIGALMSPAGMMLTAKDLSHRLSVFQPQCIIAHESVVELFDQISSSCPTLKTKIVVSESSKSKKGWLDFHRLREGVAADHKCAETNSDESMMVYFTSGTTGQPKMVEHSHASYGLGHLITGRYWHDLTSSSIFWNLSDPGWAKLEYHYFSSWSYGACTFIHDVRRFSPSFTLQVLEKYPIDTFCAPPLAYRLMVQENLSQYKFPKLSHCLSGGEALNPEVIKLWLEGTGLRVHEGYGQTEMVMVLGMYRCIEYRPGSIGKPAPGIDVVILDENENELGPGITGEIALKKKQGKIFGLFKGYKNDPEKTKNSLTENYFHTGDKAYYDKDGYFWFVGRKDDIINSAGYRIGPFEVESALMEHPAVVEVAVTSSPDKERGEVVKAFVVLKNMPQSEGEKSQLVEELQNHTKRITAPYKYPRKIEFVKDLPKTASGKIKRFELRKKEWEQL